MPKGNCAKTLRGGLRKEKCEDWRPYHPQPLKSCSLLKPALELLPSPEKIPEFPMSSALRPPQTPLNRQKENKESREGVLEGYQARMLQGKVPSAGRSGGKL